MFDWLYASPAERRLLPGGRLQGPTPWVIAIMLFVTIVVAAGGLALANAARVVGQGVANRYTIQIADGASKSGMAEAAARSSPGVTAVRPVPEAELRRTLERWLGPASLSGELPVPALIDVDLAPGAKPDAVAAAVERAAPGARFVAHRASLAPLLDALRALTWLALGLVALMGVATSAAVVLAARGALDTNRATIDVMHGIGATDAQVAGLFQRRIMLDALSGGLAGGAAAGVVLLLIAGGGGSLSGDLTGGAILGAFDIILLALLPLAGTVLATLVARAAVLGALRRAL